MKRLLLLSLVLSLSSCSSITVETGPLACIPHNPASKNCVPFSPDQGLGGGSGDGT